MVLAHATGYTPRFLREARNRGGPLQSDPAGNRPNSTHDLVSEKKLKKVLDIPWETFAAHDFPLGENAGPTSLLTCNFKRDCLAGRENARTVFEKLAIGISAS